MTQHAAPSPDIPAGAVRERLLEQALELFTTKGYAATSVREIVAAAGVSKPVLYYWFGSKEGVYLELMNGALVTFEAVVAEATATPGGVRERLTRFCTGLFDGSLANIAVVRLIYSIYFGPPQGAPTFAADQFFDRMLATLEGLVREGVATGEILPVDVRNATWAIVACFNIVLEEQLCHRPPRIDREGLVGMLALVFNGITEGEKR
jgi:AcrR family transcriptional regulator